MDQDEFEGTESIFCQLDRTTLANKGFFARAKQNLYLRATPGGIDPSVFCGGGGGMGDRRTSTKCKELF